jgi:hypothetical protein
MILNCDNTAVSPLGIAESSGMRDLVEREFLFKSELHKQALI